MDKKYGQKKILVIEDEKAMARALELKLAHAGFSIKSAYNGEEGLAMLEKEKFDFIILDLIMPQLDGFGVLAEMKKKEIKTPVMVLSNLGQAEDEKRAKALGAQEFFVKSNTPIADIVTRVQAILQK